MKEKKMGLKGQNFNLVHEEIYKPVFYGGKSLPLFPQKYY